MSQEYRCRQLTCSGSNVCDGMLVSFIVTLYLAKWITRQVPWIVERRIFKKIVMTVFPLQLWTKFIYSRRRQIIYSKKRPNLLLRSSRGQRGGGASRGGAERRVASLALIHQLRGRVVRARRDPTEDVDAWGGWEARQCILPLCDNRGREVQQEEDQNLKEGKRERKKNCRWFGREGMHSSFVW